jgi:isoleucyl-tRNA synthetase
MKKWIGILLIAGLTTGTASAAFWPFGSNDDETEDQSTTTEESQKQMQPPYRPGNRYGQSQHSKLSPEQIEKMKQARQQMRQQRQAIMKLGEAARNETDPEKKKELVDQLRVKLNEVADKMQAMHEKRLKKVEQEIDRLREQAKKMTENRDERIEKQIEKILSGEHKKGPPEGGRRRGPGKPDESVENK